MPREIKTVHQPFRRQILISTQQSSLINQTQASDFEQSIVSQNRFNEKKAGRGIAMTVSEGETVMSSMAEQSRYN